MTLILSNAAEQPALTTLGAELAQTAAEFHQRGWMLGTSGSLSARLSDAESPLTMLITVSGKDKGRLSASDLLLLADDGRIFEDLADPEASSRAFYAGQPRPSGEVLVHRAVYAKYARAGAACHTHSTAGTLCSLMVPPGEPLPLPPVEMLKGLGHWAPTPLLLPVVPNHRDIPLLAQAVGEAAREDVPGVLVAGHGIYAWGEDAMRARRNLETFEFLFELIVRSLALPPELLHWPAPPRVT